MSKNQYFYICCAKLNQALRLKRRTFSVAYSASTLRFLFCLKRNRLIYGYCIDNRTTISVFLIYNFNYPIFSRLFIYSTKKHFLSISLSTLIKFQFTTRSYINPVFFLQTALGFLTNYEALTSLCGGRVVAALF